MSQTKSQNLLLITLFLFSLFTPSICHNTITQNNESKIRGMFVFGSSLVDNGNNNFLSNSMARADYSPYGIDFPLGISGRYTNGRNVIDLLGQKLNLPNFIPPFNDPSTNGMKIINGVNFASGGSGILDDTGAVVGKVTSLNEQIRNFEEVTLPDLDLQLSRETVSSQFLFVVGSGGNDYSLNYFLGFANNNNNNITLQAFTSNLITSLSNQLKRLYNLGARKFVLMSINPNGCSPSATARLPTGSGCVQRLNQAAQLFNLNLKNLVDDIQPKLPGSNLVFVNSYNVMIDIIRFPSFRGFRDVSSSCCEVGGTGILCRRGGSICENRSSYVYFDGLHPTEAVNIVIACKAFESIQTSEVYPFNVKRLSEI
ncbi:hypothetical protein ACJIZ3_002996 [Penstemon smallii]|uniref:Uncharacterized protein n=1 Tax=Penstemon smallii TaxID=265156 RepID=A0ABD3UAV6_9LAMI